MLLTRAIIIALSFLAPLPISAAANTFLSSTARCDADSDNEDERRELFRLAQRPLRQHHTEIQELVTPLQTIASPALSKRRRASASTSDEYADDVANPQLTAPALTTATAQKCPKKNPPALKRPRTFAQSEFRNSAQPASNEYRAHKRPRVSISEEDAGPARKKHAANATPPSRTTKVYTFPADGELFQPPTDEKWRAITRKYPDGDYIKLQKKDLPRPALPQQQTSAAASAIAATQAIAAPAGATIAHDPNAPTCTLCQKKFADLQSLSEHIITHARRDPKQPLNGKFLCPLCAYIAKNRHSLHLHVCAKHTNYKPEQCPHCDFATVQPTNLRYHVGAMHSDTVEARRIIARRPSQHTHTHRRMLHTAARTDIVYGPAPMRKKPIMFNGKKMPKNWEAETENEVCALCNTGFPDEDAVCNHIEEVHGIASPLRKSYAERQESLRKTIKEHNAQQQQEALKDTAL